MTLHQLLANPEPFREAPRQLLGLLASPVLASEAFVGLGFATYESHEDERPMA